MRRLLVLVALLLGGALLAAAPASAHATVVTSDPADGARLKSMPGTVTISFDEQVGLGAIGYLHVTDQTGKRVEVGAAFHPGQDGTKIAATLKPGLRDGTYVESYRVVSADSHPVAGVVRFVVGTGPLVSTNLGASSSAVNHVVSVAFDVSRWISYAGFAVLGGVWLLLTVWPQGRDDRRAARFIWAGWTATALGAILELLLQGAYTAGKGLSSALNPTLIDSTLHTDYGQYHCVRLVLLGVLGGLLGSVLQPARGRVRAEHACWPLAVAVAFTFAATGHADTTNPRWLSVSLDTAHLLAMAVWVGGLVLLIGAVLPRREVAEVDAVLPVFSRTAFAAVVVLAATGTYAAWRGVGSWRALVVTEYGLLVLAKVALFLGLLALGNLSRRVVQRRVRGRLVAYAMTDDVLEEPADGLDATTPELDTEQLRRSVLVEVALAVIVLGVTSVLVAQPRGAEALVVQDREPVSASASLGGGSSTSVTVDPGQHGTVDVEVSVVGAAPKLITATATQPAQQLGPIPLKLVAAGAGHYSATGVDLPVAGHWVIALVLTSSQFDAVTTQVTIDLS